MSEIKIVNIIPIAKGILQEKLSYFTDKDVGPGALVIVPVRKKDVLAIVSSIESTKSIKAALKKSGLRLKKIKSVKTSSFFLPEFMEACAEIAKYFVSPVGAVIKDFMPQDMQKNPILLDGAVGPSRASHFEIMAIQAQKEDRLSYYKGIVREEFAKNHSVFLCLPTASEINEFSIELQKGIENYVVLLHGKIPKKKKLEIWRRVLAEEHPLLIIATKSFFSLPRKDIGTIILDGESSAFYKMQKRPYLDARKAAELISKRLKNKLIFGDSVLRSETACRFSAYSARMASQAEQIIIGRSDLRFSEGRTFAVISDELQKIIKEAMDNKERVVLFVNRRGHSPTTVCNDCQRTILCDKCDTPLVIHKKENHKINFICHKCLEETFAFDKCPYCKSHRLETLGIGIQKIEGEIAKISAGWRTDIKVFRMDSDAIKTEKQGEEMVKKFNSSDGAILLGTEIIFSYLRQPVDRVGVVSIDSLFTLPDFRINEKIFSLLLRLRSLAKKTFLIQTRMAEQKLFDYATRGNVSGFYKTELENRKAFGYPPFKLLIKITREGRDKFKIKKETDLLAKKLQKWDPVIYPAFIPKIKNIYAWHILLKIDPDTWPDSQPELHQILSFLPLNWKINVNPESLL